MITKEELKELLKGRFEECSQEEANWGDFDEFVLKTGYLKFGGTQENPSDIFFKPVEQFPIIFEGENFRFIIGDDLKLVIESGMDCFFTEKDIKANQEALDKLKELRQC